MVENIILVLAAVIGTVGFSFMLRLRKERLPIIAISTALCYSIYLLCIHFDIFICSDYYGVHDIRKGKPFSAE